MGSETSEPEEDDVLPASSGVPDWHLQILHVKLLTW